MLLKPSNINEKCLIFSLRRAARAISQSFDAQLAPYGLRASQWHILIEIEDKKNKSLTEIATHLFLDRTTLTRNLKPLEKAGLIALVIHQDKRIHSYIITEKGAHMMSLIKPIWDKNTQILKSLLGQDFLTRLIEDLSDVSSKSRQIKK